MFLVKTRPEISQTARRGKNKSQCRFVAQGKVQWVPGRLDQLALFRSDWLRYDWVLFFLFFLGVVGNFLKKTKQAVLTCEGCFQIHVESLLVREFQWKCADIVIFPYIWSQIRWGLNECWMYRDWLEILSWGQRGAIMKQKGWERKGKRGPRAKRNREAEEYGEQQGGGFSVGGGCSLVEDSWIHLKVNRNSLAPFGGTSVILRGGASGLINAGATTRFIC